MWPFSSSTEPPVVEVRVQIKATGRLLNINHFKKAIKKAIPSITKEEMEVLIEDYNTDGKEVLRVTKKAAKVLKKYPKLFEVRYVENLRNIEDICRCGYDVCSGCVMDARESKQYSATNNGIIRDSDNNQEFDYDTGEALIHQYKEVPHARVR